MSFEPRGFCASLSQKLNTCVRTIPKYFLLFEKLINVVHEHALRQSGVGSDGPMVMIVRKA